MEHKKALLFAFSVLLTSCTTVLTQSGTSTDCPIEGSLGAFEFNVDHCDAESYVISWQMSNICKEFECYIVPTSTCEDEEFPNTYDYAASTTYRWPMETNINECTVLGCFSNVSGTWFAIRPKVLIMRESQTCNIVTLQPTNMVTSALPSVLESSAFPSPSSSDLATMLTSALTSILESSSPSSSNLDSSSMTTTPLMAPSESPAGPDNNVAIILACTFIGVAGLVTLVLIFAVVLVKHMTKRDVYKYYGDVKPFGGKIDDRFNPVKIHKEPSVESIMTMLEKLTTTTKDWLEQTVNNGNGPGTTNSMDFSLCQDHELNHTKSNDKRSNLVGCRSLPTLAFQCDSSLHKAKSDTGHQNVQPTTTHFTADDHGYVSHVSESESKLDLDYDQNSVDKGYIAKQKLDCITELDSESNFHQLLEELEMDALCSEKGEFDASQNQNSVWYII